jgi:Fe-Mn family superoxide dismutase
MKILFASLAVFLFCNGANIEPIDFSYLKEKMPKLHPGLLEIHLKLYSGYVAQVNYIDSQLNLEQDPFVLQSLRKQYGFEFDGMRLHELYFSQLGGNGTVNTAKSILNKIVKDYKSFDAFKAEVASYAKTRGIGWVILFSNLLTGDLKLCWICDHEKGLLAGFSPIFVIDLWEHAYIAQFGLDKNAYINLMFEYTNWDEVNDRYNKSFTLQKINTTYQRVKK